MKSLATRRALVFARTQHKFASPERTDKLQRAGRDFLMRLVAEYGPFEAARILRALAREIEELARDRST